MKRALLTMVVLSTWLSGCHGAPVTPQNVPPAAAAANGTVVVSLSVSAGSRSVLATAADVAQLLIRLRKPDGTEVLKTLDSTQWSTGSASVTFTEVVAGWSRLSVTALDGSGASIGFGVQDVQVVAGQMAPVDMKLRLDPTYVSGTGQPAGGLTVGFVDTFPAGTVLGVYPLPASIFNHSASARGLEFDPTGQVWAVGHNQATPIGPDGTAGTPVTFLPPSNNPVAVRMDQRGNWWVWQSSDQRVDQLTTAGTLIRSYSGYGGVSCLGPNGAVCLGGTTNHLIDENGQVIGTFPTPPIAFNAARNEYWALASSTTPNSMTLQRFKPTGELAGEFEVADWESQRELEFDAQGHLWGIFKGVVRQYDVDGTLLGTYQAGIKPLDLTFDQAGDVWVIGETRGAFNVTRLSPAGVITGKQTVEFLPWRIKTGPSGHVWVMGPGAFRDTNPASLAKIAP